MFTVYKASAGSGKTTRLVIEYLALSLPNPDKFKHILAITFTNNATAEMKSRILDTLYAFAFEKMPVKDTKFYHPYSQIALMIAAKKNEEEQFTYIQHQSKLLLNKILYNYDSFSISTIDSFFQRILRAFSFEFGLSPQFNLEIQLDDLFDETIAMLIQKITPNNKQITKLILDLVHKKMQEKGKWKIERDVIELLEILHDEESKKPIEKLQNSSPNFEAAKQKIMQRKRMIEPQLANIPTRQITKDPHLSELREELKELDFVNRTLYQLALLVDLKIIIDEIKEQDNKFYLSETNYEINKKLEDNDVPFIYEKLGIKYSYFFIDEFQDTSKLQWNNIIPLIKNALSGTNQFNEPGKGYLFGDVKQAIYRFRNGEATLLQNLSSLTGFQHSVFPNAEENKDYKLELLGTNYRSSKNVIDFNNQFFKYFFTDLIQTDFPNAPDYYADVIQKIKPNAASGIVSITFQQNNIKEDFTIFAFPEILQKINEVMGRNYTYGDIAILVNGNALASDIGAHLIQNNIPVISSESLALSSSAQIRLLIACLHYINNQSNNLAVLAIHQLDATPPTQSDCEKWANYPVYTLLKELCIHYQINICNPFMVRFFDEIEAVVLKKNADISAVLKWWEEKGESLSLSSPKTMNAVTISTIHKSKGLEYPIVILPFSRWGTTKTKPYEWIEDPKKTSGLALDLVKLSEKTTPAEFMDKFLLEDEKTKLDKLNTLYVAHTRASNELHILTVNNLAKATNYSKRLKSFIDPNSILKPSNEQECFWYSNGKFTTEKPAIDPKRLTEEINTEPLPEKNLDFSLSDFSIDSTHLSIHTLIQTEEQKRGIYVHDFMASLAEFPQNEIDIATTINVAVETYRQYLESIFMKIIGDLHLFQYFKKGVKVLNERSLLLPNGNILRPDRVVFIDNAVVVIDYKTGVPLQKHQFQIDEYCDAFRQMGYENVRGEILYI